MILLRGSRGRRLSLWLGPNGDHLARPLVTPFLDLPPPLLGIGAPFRPPLAQVR